MSTAAAPATRPTGLAAFTTPKHLIAGLIALILVIGEWQYGVLGGYERLAIALGTCMLTEFVLSLWILGKRPVSLLSPFISGNSIALLLKPQEGLLWPFAACAVLSIAGKYVLRFKGRHLWNPTNFGVAMMLLIAAPKTAILGHEWGNDLRVNLVIWAIGLVVVRRARLLHVTAAYVLTFFALAWPRALLAGVPYMTEVAPITGPMYQLFVFFMITDPPTTLPSFKGRLLVAVLIGVVECLLRMSIDMHWAWAQPFAPAPAFYALFSVGPIALIIQRSRAAKRAPATARPATA
ncbi:MAG: hypothetical protein H6825_06335 [Planctomycetes bacterium]|nr:hypothetical protein [Planctomycetota bacterium]